MAKRSAPEVNAGSMADIAFLLLIFFLVTTTIENNSGLLTVLPQKPEEEQPPPPIKEKNIFTVLVNKNDQLLVEEEITDLKDLKDKAVAFLDNGGGKEGVECSYCKGERDPTSSDNPNKAVISLRNDRQTSYKMYVSVQNELLAAYNQLRNRISKELFPEERSFVAMEAEYADSKTEKKRKEILKVKIKKIQSLYPKKLSEAEPKRF